MMAGAIAAILPLLQKRRGEERRGEILYLEPGELERRISLDS